MDQEEARRRLTAASVARLATVTPAGLPHVVPVVFALVQDVLYMAVDNKPKTTTALQRLANIEASGRASLLVDHYTEDWSTLWWVRVDGSAEVLSVAYPHQRSSVTRSRSQQVDVGLEALTNKYPQYCHRPPPGPVIALRITQWRWWQAVAAM
jgi:PPOX class probable F420-dependent enzyme